jgi:hypothetical protein
MEYSYKYSAIIIEPRCHPSLEFVLNNFTSNLNEDWGFIIFHGNLNYEYVNDIITKIPNYDVRIKLFNLNIDNLTIEMYNNLLKNIDLYENIPTETFLIFQTDTLINPKYKHLIYEFIDYDYVGAPWSFNSQVGNGGLSLRKKSKMIDIIKKKKYYLEINKHIVELNKNEHEIYVNVNEDSYFSLNDIRFQIDFGNEISYDLIIHHDVELNKPTFETAKRFSCESILTEIHFGIHQAYCWTDDLQILYNYFPLALELGKLNSNEKCINFLNNLNTFKN